VHDFLVPSKSYIGATRWWCFPLRPRIGTCFEGNNTDLAKSLVASQHQSSEAIQMQATSSLLVLVDSSYILFRPCRWLTGSEDWLKLRTVRADKSRKVGSKCVHHSYWLLSCTQHRNALALVAVILKLFVVGTQRDVDRLANDWRVVAEWPYSRLQFSPRAGSKAALIGPRTWD